MGSTEFHRLVDVHRVSLVPSGNLLQFAIENDPVEIVDFPSSKMVDLSIMYQRVNPIKFH